MALVALRLPTIVEPAGADQGLYAYVAGRIAQGDLPYRDAWDQKPPLIHFTYALMFGVWPHQAVVAAADLVVAVLVSTVLVGLGRALSGAAAGQVAALVFMALANPAFTRLGGIRTRAQCETFLALAVAAALLALARGPGSAGEGCGRPQRTVLSTGLLFGLAFLYKFNAAAYAVVGVLALAIWWHGRHRLARDLPLLAAGFLVPVVAMGAVFLAGGALDDLWEATVTYNLRYSGETYEGGAAFLAYLLSFPVQHARVDVLWMLGGVACVVLSIASVRRPALAVVPLWVATACVSIAVNGSRGLPQYFVQAAPALALAIGIASVVAWRSLRPVARALAGALLVVAAARVGDFQKPVDYLAHDLGYLAGRMSRAEHLARFGGYGSGEKFAALAVSQLADRLADGTKPDERVLVFGFSPWAYVQSQRTAASRFFWSRPIVSGFNAGRAGYGPEGLLRDLEAGRPGIVVLERNDEGLDERDSASYFMATPPLRDWLAARYEAAGELEDYLLWRRR